MPRQGSTVVLVAGASRHRALVSAIADARLRAIAVREVPRAEVPAEVGLIVLDGEAERLSGYRSLAALRGLPGGAQLPVVLVYSGSVPDEKRRPSGERVMYLAGGASDRESATLLRRFRLAAPTMAPGEDDAQVPFTALVARAPLGIAVLGHDGGVRFVNATFLALAGKGEDGVRSSPFAGLRTPGSAEMPLDLATTAKHHWVGEVSFEWDEHDRARIVTVERAPDGRDWLLWLAEATPAPHAGQALSETARMEAIERLAGGVAHDFNNVLSVITTLSDLLIRLRPEGDPDLEDLQEIHRAAQRGSEIARQLSAFSRTTPGEPEELDLDARLIANEKMFRRILSEDISLFWALGGELPTVRVDPMQLDQMILNLALNARDAMPEGGALTIGSTVREMTTRAEMYGLVVEPGSYVVVTVSDTGVGMDEPTRRRLFEPFFTTRGWGRRSGLGLAMVYGTVRAMGGAIRVESELGRGSRFEILIPAVSSPGGPAASPDTPTGTESVLLVEDHAELRRGMGRALAQLGYQVVDAADGEEALALVREGGLRPHLLLTDVVMPALSGPELNRRIEGLGLSIPTLFLSGHTDHPAVIRLRRAGVRVLSKPLGTLELAREVRAALDRSVPDLPSDSA